MVYTNYPQVVFTNYGDRSKRQRKIMHKALGGSAISANYPLLVSETSAFLRRLIADPLNYLKHARRHLGGTTLCFVYGIDVVSDDDEYLREAEECVDIITNKIMSGGGVWPVDVLPFLQYLPPSLPGMGFKRKAIQWKARMDSWVNKPYEYVKRTMVCLIRHLVPSD